MQNPKFYIDNGIKANALKAWQNGTLVDDKALKLLSLKELKKINDMLTKAGY